MKKSYSQIADMIREARIEKKLTQQELAYKLGLKSSQFIHLIETQISKCPLNTIGKLIVILDLPEEKIKKLLVDEYVNDIRIEIRDGARVIA